MPTKYEYKTIEIYPNTCEINKTYLDDMLNKYGAEVWELVISTPLGINGATIIIYYTFRRAI
ncbi:DUF4177 domain-containing protein [Empedobacter brevis]|uniref:DUF4177 domain-containing protein n=1 Tax=Empedobacter brevis TaxID=247 RepID=UPI0039AF6458